MDNQHHQLPAVRILPPSFATAAGSSSTTNVSVASVPDRRDNRMAAPKRTFIDSLVTRDDNYWRERSTLKIDVSFHDHSHIIGRSGMNTQAIMKDTKCHIHFPDSNKSREHSKSNKVTLAGDIQQVEVARSRVRSLAPISVTFKLGALVPPYTAEMLADHPALEKLLECSTLHVIVRLERSETPYCIVRGSIYQQTEIVRAVQSIALKILQPDCRVEYSCSLDIQRQEQPWVRGVDGRHIAAIMQRTGAQLSFPRLSEAHRGATAFEISAGNIQALFAARAHVIGLLPVQLSFDLRRSITEVTNTTDIEQRLGVSVMFHTRQNQDSLPVQAVQVSGVEFLVDRVYQARAELIQDNQTVVCTEYQFMSDFAYHAVNPNSAAAPPGLGTMTRFGPSHAGFGVPPQSMITNGAAQTQMHTAGRRLLPPVSVPPRFSPAAAQLLSGPTTAYNALCQTLALQQAQQQRVIGWNGRLMYPQQSNVPSMMNSPTPSSVSIIGMLRSGMGMQQAPAQQQQVYHHLPPSSLCSTLSQSQFTVDNTESGQVSTNVTQDALDQQQVTNSSSIGDTPHRAEAGAQPTAARSLNVNVLSTNSTPMNEPSIVLGPVSQLPPPAATSEQKTGSSIVLPAVPDNVANDLSPLENSPMAKSLLGIARNQDTKRAIVAHKAMRAVPAQGEVRRPSGQWQGEYFSQSQQQPVGTATSSWPLPKVTQHANALPRCIPNRADLPPRSLDFAATSMYGCGSGQSPSDLPLSMLLAPEASRNSQVATVEVLLVTLGLAQLCAVFREHEVDVETLMSLTEEDLKEMGLSLGQRKKLLNFLYTYKMRYTNVVSPFTFNGPPPAQHC